ncbi:MAG: hypothetical protein K2Y22_16855 [Candidatus Obscuribacterales bacterium]|nr:hypothetical protein [Candidatus Obscuribacterales bacterium]
MKAKKGSAFAIAALIAIIASSNTSAYADKVTDAKETGEYVVTMGDIRDVGLCLKQIQQQAVFIFLEATRKELPINSPGRIIEPKTLTTEGLNFKEDYLPARREWLVFFIGSMEPLIRLMGNDVKDVENGLYAVSVPNISKAQFDRRWKEWSDTVTNLNMALDKINDSLANETGNNQLVASQAVAIYNDAQKLEHLRMLVHHLMQAHHHKSASGTAKPST